MSGKVVITLGTAVLLTIGGCATPRQSIDQAIPPMENSSVMTVSTPPPTAPAARPTPRPTPRPAVRPTVRPAPAPAAAPDFANLPRLIRGRSTWTKLGETLMVHDGTPGGTQPVPLFRQAIVLANVRAALSGSTPEPRTEFRRGLLSLSFDQGNPSQIASSINRALSVPEVNRLVVDLPK